MASLQAAILTVIRWCCFNLTPLQHRAVGILMLRSKQKRGNQARRTAGGEGAGGDVMGPPRARQYQLDVILTAHSRRSMVNSAIRLVVLAFGPKVNSSA
jgi:hypothetical protein